MDCRTGMNVGSLSPAVFLLPEKVFIISAKYDKINNNCAGRST